MQGKHPGRRGSLCTKHSQGAGPVGCIGMVSLGVSVGLGSEVDDEKN